MYYMELLDDCDGVCVVDLVEVEKAHAGWKVVRTVYQGCEDGVEELYIFLKAEEVLDVYEQPTHPDASSALKRLVREMFDKGLVQGFKEFA